MPGDSNGTIAAAGYRTQLRQHMRHSDANGTVAYTDARLASPCLLESRDDPFGMNTEEMTGWPAPGDYGADCQPW
jgi:hypothetical protein